MAAAAAAAAYNYDADFNSRNFSPFGSEAYKREMARAASYLGPGWTAEVIYQDEHNAAIGFKNPNGDPGLAAVRGTDDLADDQSEYVCIERGVPATYAPQVAAAIEGWLGGQPGRATAKGAVVGHSLGGWVAQVVGRISPEIVSQTFNLQGPSIKETTLVQFDAFIVEVATPLSKLPDLVFDTQVVATEQAFFSGPFSQLETLLIEL
jgi:hypothetical protein